jgi:hypothetical protein
VLDIRLAQQTLKSGVYVSRPLEAEMVAVSQSAEIFRLYETWMFHSSSEPYGGINPRRSHHRAGEANPLLQHDPRLLRVDRDWSCLSRRGNPTTECSAQCGRPSGEVRSEAIPTA